MAKKTSKVLTLEELTKRKELCAIKNLYFISKKPLAEDKILITHPEVGQVLVNDIKTKI